MSRITLLCAAAWLLVSEAAVASSSVTGTVTNAATGAALKSMVVAAYSTSGTLQATATTDSAGHYVLTPPPGNDRLLAYDPGLVFATAFATNADSFDTTPAFAVGTQSITVNFALQTGGTISGAINSVAGPVSQSVVAAYNVSSGTRRNFTLTGAPGTYALLLPPGQYKIAAYDNAGTYVPRFFPDVYNFGSATSIAVASSAMISGNNIDLEVAGHLNGIVVDADSGGGLPGKSVYAYAANGLNIAQSTTDAGGNFGLNVPPGSYQLVAADQNQIYAAGFLGDTESFGQSTPVPVVSLQSVANLQIPLHRGGNVTGHVMTSAGTPLSQMTVAAYNDDGAQRTTVPTDTSGGYLLVLPPGNFRVAAYDLLLGTFATQFYSSKGAFAEATDVAVTASATVAAIDFTLAHGGNFAGTITDAAGGAPAAGVGIAAYDSLGNPVNSVVSGTAGAYMLLVPAGTYKIAAFDSLLRYATAYGGGAPNYDTAMTYTVNSDQLQTVNFAMVRGTQLHGTVTDYLQRPLSRIEIGALDVSGKRVATAVASQGAFALALLPGSYVLAARDLSGHYSTVYYSQSPTLAGAAVVVVQAGTPPAAVAFVLGSPPRHRAVGH